jgi:hypothetical protein
MIDDKHQTADDLNTLRTRLKAHKMTKLAVVALMLDLDGDERIALLAQLALHVRPRGRINSGARK